MPNFSGLWTVTQQMQARGASTWPATPGAPTIGTATAGVANCASVTFTAPGCTGYPAGVTGYRVISTPGCVTKTGASSPLVVTGLTSGTSYTFKAQATNSTGYGTLSAASNSITATLQTCATYTTAGSYSWVAPAGVTSVSVVAVGGGGSFNQNGGGGLGYKNNYSVTPGNSYSVVVGAGAYAGTSSYFVSTTLVKGGGGGNCAGYPYGVYVGDGGGNGGATNASGGGGAGGYCGNGGYGAGLTPQYGQNGVAGAGGGGGSWGCYCVGAVGGGGGGVGIFGQGSIGLGGGYSGSNYTNAVGCGGSGGSGGTDGQATYAVNIAGGNGGSYGGGSGRNSIRMENGRGGGGAVRIVWAGGARGTPSFPSTNVGP